MIDYTLNNHMTFGYGGKLFADKAIGDNVEYQFSRAARLPISFEDECRCTANIIIDEAEAAGRVPYALVSGGLDSLAMVKGFLETGRPFKTATYAFTKGFNEHELEHVRELVEAEGLDHEYLWIDSLKWLKSSEAHELFHRTNCCELGTLPLMKLMEHVWFERNGYPAFGGGDMDIIKLNGQWHYSRFESFLSRFWYSDRFGLGVFASFFQYTPEMILSILNEPEILKAGRGENKLANSVLNELKQVKYNVMHRTWPGVRRRLKYGGTELIHPYIAATEEAWQKERSVRFDETWTKPFEEFRRSLLPDGALES